MDFSNRISFYIWSPKKKMFNQNSQQELFYISFFDYNFKMFFILFFKLAFFVGPRQLTRRRVIFPDFPQFF